MLWPSKKYKFFICTYFLNIVDRKSYESIAGMDSEDETDKESNYGGGNDSDFQVENFDNSDSGL